MTEQLSEHPITQLTDEVNCSDEKTELKANLSILDRSEIITEIKNEIFSRAKQINLNEISLMVYGSSSYNFYSGKAEDSNPHIDFDSIGIISDEKMSYNRFISAISQLFSPKTPPPESVYSQLIAGTVGILMIKGAIKNHEVNIHFTSLKTVKKLMSGIGNQSAQTLYTKTMPTFDVLYRGYYLANGEIADSMAAAKTHESDSKYWSVTDPISRKDLKTGQIVKDILADKFLSASVVWDPSNAAIWASKRIWTNYVRACLYYNPNLRDEEILNMIHRAERFSPMYREKLLRRIRKEKEILSRRILRQPYTPEDNSYIMSLQNKKDNLEDYYQNEAFTDSEHLYGSEAERYLNLINWAGIKIYELNHTEITSAPNTSDGVLGNKFMTTASQDDIIDFYKNVILENILLLIQAQNNNSKPDSQLQFTIDPSPKSFIFENGQWLYKHSFYPLTIKGYQKRIPDIFDKVKIWKECLLKISEQKPEDFPRFYQETINFLQLHQMHREALYIQEYF